MGALTPGLSLTPQEFANEIAARLMASIESLGFQNGGPEPSSDVGPWLKNGTTWKFWNAATGSYSLGIFQSGIILPTGEAAVVETDGEWLVCDGRQVNVTGYQSLFNSIGYGFNLPADMSGVTPVDPTKFRIPDGRGRTFIGQGTGTGLTLRTIGQLIGAETHVLTIAQLASHNHSVSGATGGTIPGQGFAVPGAVVSSQNTSSVGANEPHNNMQPSQVATWKIKT